jgi:hypothetical protein
MIRPITMAIAFSIFALSLAAVGLHITAMQQALHTPAVGMSARGKTISFQTPNIILASWHKRRGG